MLIAPDEHGDAVLEPFIVGCWEALVISTDELRAAARERGLPVDDMAMLRQSLTHKSLVPHNPLASNERLEFLGDAILGLVINEFLYEVFPHRKEGDLDKAKALIVCQASLAEASRR